MISVMCCHTLFNESSESQIGRWVDRNSLNITLVEFAALITGIVLLVIGGVYLSDYPDWSHGASVIFSMGMVGIILPVIGELSVTALSSYEVRTGKQIVPSLRLFINELPCFKKPSFMKI